MYNIISLYNLDNKYYFDSFVKACLKNRNLDDFKRARTTLDNFLTQESLLRVPDSLLASQLTDLLDIFWPKMNQKTNRLIDRIQTIADICAQFGLKPRSILDIGCGDGSITSNLAQFYDIPRENVYGVEIKDVINERINIIRPGEVKNIPDGSINLALMFMSLHHIKDIDPVLAEVHRVLSPDGIFIIREHDCKKGESGLIYYLNALHAMVFADESASADPAAYKQLYNEIYYQSKEYWFNKIKSHGLKLIWQQTYEGNNPQKIFHAAFRKIEY